MVIRAYCPLYRYTVKKSFLFSIWLILQYICTYVIYFTYIGDADEISSEEYDIPEDIYDTKGFID